MMLFAVFFAAEKVYSALISLVGIRNKAIDKGCSKSIVVEYTRLVENVVMSFKLYSVDSDAPICDELLEAARCRGRAFFLHFDYGFQIGFGIARGF